MILTLLFSAMLYLLLWGYFILQKKLDFNSSPGDMEVPLSGRPARRTIGRVNSDIQKCMLNIIAGYFFINAAFIIGIDFTATLTYGFIVIIIIAVLAVVVFGMTPANRLLHAYIPLGQIAVVHFVSMIASFSIVNAIYNDEALTTHIIQSMAIMCLGAMVAFYQPTRAIGKVKNRENSL